MHCHSSHFIRFCMRSDAVAAIKINKMAYSGFPCWEGEQGEVLLIFSKVNKNPLTKNKPIYQARNVSRWKGSVEPRTYIGLLILDVINRFITCFTKYSNNLLSYTVRYCSCFRTHSGLLMHQYRTARASISVRLRSSIKMAERPMEPQAFNTLTSFYKNNAQKAVKICVCKQIIWLYYGMKWRMATNFPHLYDGKQGEKQLSIKPG